MASHHQEEIFHDNPSQNLRIENEILKLKMQAEFGGMFQSESNLPPEIEAAFLNHVYAFEKAWQNGKIVRLYDFIGKPQFVNETVLNDQELRSELNKFLVMLREKNIILQIPDGVSCRDVYKFLTEFLFEQEIDDIQMDGFFRYFSFGEDAEEVKEE